MARTSTILAAWNRVRKRSFSMTLSEDLDAKAVVPYWAGRRRPNCPHLSHGPTALRKMRWLVVKQRQI